MFGIGRVCVKLAGRDAGKKCLVVDILDDNFVLIDGETRRRKCNVIHLEPLDEVVDIAKGASHERVCKALGIKAAEKRQKAAKEDLPRPRRLRKAPDSSDEKPRKAKEKKAKKEEPKQKEKKGHKPAPFKQESKDKETHASGKSRTPKAKPSPIRNSLEQKKKPQQKK